MTDSDTSPPRWSVFRALAVGWLLPATAARRTARLSLVAAFCVHVVACILAALLMIVLEGWSDTYDFARLLADSEELLGGFLEEVADDPLYSLSVFGITALTIESLCLLLAVLVMSWGARDEPMRASLAYAVRQTWLHTARVLPVILLIGGVGVQINRARMEWYRQLWDKPAMAFPDPPQAPTTQPLGSQAWQDAMATYQKEVQAAQQAWAAAWEEREKHQPWLLRHTFAIKTTVAWVAIGWFVWALLRALGAVRVTVPIVRPPLCERCGYDLTAAPMEGRCPECGDAVMASLGPDVRPGTQWDHRRECGRLRAWWRCSVDSLRHPSVFGRDVQVLSHPTGHRLVLLVNLIATYVVGLLGIWFCVYVNQQILFFPIEAGQTVATVGFGAAFSTGIGLLAVTGAAGLVGIIFRVIYGRNVMGGAMQVACYQSGYLVLWATFDALLGAALLGQQEWYRELRQTRAMSLRPELFAFLFWLMANGVALLGFVWLVGRGTAATRYANR